MGTKYSTVLVGGVVQTYNDTPPSDDGSETEANRVKFATITSDLTAPLHSAITSMDAKVVSQTNEGPLTKAGAYTTTLAEHNTVIECSGTIPITLLDPSGNKGYQVTVKNAGSGVVTLDVDVSGTIDGSASITLPPGSANRLHVNDAETGYLSITGVGTGDNFASGTVMLFMQNAAPTGWTKKTDSAYDNVAMRVSTGTVSDVTSGSVDFDTVFGLSATDTFTLLETHLPAHSHTSNSHTHALTGKSNSGSVSFQTAGAIFASQTGGSNFYMTKTGTPISNTTSVASATPTQQNTGGNTAHAHDIDLQVRYRDVIAAQKD